MRATLCNISHLPRRHWALLTLPTPIARKLGSSECSFTTDDGRSFRMVRGRTVGCKTAFRVRAKLLGHEIVTGEISPQPHSGATEKFAMHRWVGDSAVALIPKLGVRVQVGMSTQDFWTEDLRSVVRIDASPAHERFRLERRIPEAGIHFTWWADVLHGDPVMPIRGKVVWSHRADPSPVKVLQWLSIQAGELIAFDFAKNLGIADTMPDGQGGWFRLLNLQPVSLQDGAGLPLSGSMLAFVSGQQKTPPPANVADVDPDVANLLAAQHGPILGVSHDWDGLFLANENVPHFAGELEQQHAQEYQQWVWRMANYAGWTAPRGLGSAMTPSQTGDQEDFGAAKATAAIARPFDPRFIYRLQESMHAEILRGFCHHEDDGNQLQTVNHPQWVTWQGQTHWHHGVSPDRLGKDAAAVPVGTGYTTHDDQHRSHNNYAAYLALSDDPLAEDLLRFLAQVDLAAYRVRFPTFGVDTARAQGRTAQALAQLISTVDRETAAVFRQVMDARLDEINRNPDLNVPGPMKVLSWGGPDVRKPVRTPDGQLGRFMPVWEHGLAMVGLYIAWKLTRDPMLGRTLQIVAETLALFGCFKEGEQWWTVDDILWSDGEAPAQGLSSTSPAVLCGPDIGGTRSWTFAGLLAVREVLGPGHALYGKLDAYCRFTTGNHESGGDRRQAEWWAVVRSVVSP